LKKRDDVCPVFAQKMEWC